MKKLRSKLKAGLIIPDQHIPYNDEVVWDLMMQVAKDIKPYFIRILGDFADCYSVSFHSKDPRRAGNLDYEIDLVNQKLDELDTLGAANKEYCAGNHEDRIERYIRDRAPAIFNMMKIDGILKLKERGWKYVPYKKSSKLGKLHFTHDVGSATRYSVFKCLDTFAASNATGHTHRFAYVVEGTATGDVKLSCQFGWGGDVEKVDYMHRVQAMKNWANGFGIFYLDETSGIVYVVPVPVIKKTCMVGGKLYVAK